MPTAAATFLTIGVRDIDGDGDLDGDGVDGNVDDDYGFNFFLAVAHSRCHFFSPSVGVASALQWSR